MDMNDKNNPNYKHMKWLERATGLKQQIQGFTRYSDKNSCIDHLFTNMQDNFSTKILDVNLSDHQFLYLNRKHTPKPKDKIDFTGRSYKNYDEKLFCLQLLQEDWVEYYSSRNVDVAWNILYNKILLIADRMCPLKRYKVAQANDPWITNEILEMIKDKDRLLRKAKKRKLAADWENAKLARNNTNAIIHQAKTNFIKENLNEHHDDSKKFWQIIHTILPSSLNSKRKFHE